MKRLIVAMTGASGAIYGIRALEALRRVTDIETHLIVSPAAAHTIAEETDISVSNVKALADMVHRHRDIGASLSSGSYRTLGMLIAPCSIKTLGGIANSDNENLVVRAADVCLKERRRVVALVRETPLHAGHIELMARATRNGVVVMPPVPAFYHRPRTIDDIVDQTVGRDVHDGRRIDWQAGDALIVENACVHQHFNDDPDEEALVLVMKAKPLFLFMHMLFQKVVDYPPKEPVPGQEGFRPPEDI